LKSEEEIKERMEFCEQARRDAKKEFSVEDYYYWLGQETALEWVLED